MPWSEHRIPQYRKHRASGKAIVTIAGRDFYLGPYGTNASKLEYDRLIAEWIASGRSASFGLASTELTVVEVLAGFWKHCQEQYGKGHPGELMAFKMVIRTIRDLYSKTSATQFGPQQLKAIREYWIAQHGWSRNYVNHQAKRVCRIWKWAAAEGLLPADIYQQLRLVPGLKKGKTAARENEPVTPIDDDTVLKTLEHMGRIPADMVRVQLLCGCRPAEICQLTPAMIDRSKTIWEATLTDHKTSHHGHARTLYFGPKAQAILKRYLLRGEHEPLFQPCEADRERRSALHEQRTTSLACGNKPGSNVVRHPRKKPGSCYTTASYRRAIHYACDKAFPPPEELEDESLKEWQSDHRWSPNRLRHSAATKIRKEFGLEAAAATLGHAEIGVTQVYAEQDRQRAIEVAMRIG